jgi:predicted ATPase
VKLAKIAIENLRHLGTASQPLEISFTDPLDRVRDFTLLVGPNAVGKTTILDAVALALGRSVGMAALRPDFKVSPRTVVRRGALHAQVTCWLRFSPDEIAATRDIFRLAEISEEVPDAREVKLTWTYPSPKKPSRNAGATTVFLTPAKIPYALSAEEYYWNPSSGASVTYQPRIAISNQPGQDYGVIRCEPETGWVLLHGRDQAARLLATGRADWSWFHRVGGVFTFDQERTGLGKTISRQVWNIIHGTAEAARESEELRSTDPRTILIELALQSLVPSIASKSQATDEFRLIQETYARVCAPRRILGAVGDELGEFDIYFTDGHNEYTYEGLSSGEKNVLLMLVRFAAERMHRSIVMVDEMELNQHPIWQRKLLHLIPQMGEDNQIIATTHSPYLRDAVRPDAIIDLGDLGDHSNVGAL